MACCLRSCRSTRPTADGQPVGALRAWLSGKVIWRFACPKLTGQKMAPLAAMMLPQADTDVVLAAADGGVRDPALERRFIDYVQSPDDVLPFVLFVREPLADATPYSPRGKASVIIDLLARGGMSE